MQIHEKDNTRSASRRFRSAVSMSGEPFVGEGDQKLT